ncbi:MAG: heme exporter protein CcmD [Rhodobacteraceae bacterium]|nr:heme exporter protein CcmD [Paracoccaceae bacterium]
MMPDLGKHAVSVLAAYGVAGVLIAALVAVTLWQGARMRRDLGEVERRQRGRLG